MSKISQLKEMIEKSKSISVVIHTDYKSNIEGKSYNNATVRLEDNLLIIEDAIKQAELTEDSILEIKDENVEIKLHDEDGRNIYLGMLIR